MPAQSLLPDVVLVHDPDLGPMKAVTLPPTSLEVWGVPIVVDVDRQVLTVPPGTDANGIIEAIQQHTRTTGHPPRVVICQLPPVQ